MSKRTLPATVLAKSRIANITISQCWVALEFVFVFFMYVETKGPTLEELAKVIDGEEAQVAHLDLRQVQKEQDIITHEEYFSGKS